MKHLQCEENDIYLNNTFQDMKTKLKKETKTKDRKVRTKNGIESTTTDNVKDLSNDPFLNKKDAEMKKIIEKAGHAPFPPREK